MAGGEFAEKYRAVLEQLGQPVEPSHGMAGTLPRWLPRSLRELYRVAGNHPLNRVHHRLLPPDDLVHDDKRVVFAEENQVAVVWAFESEERSDDPNVWQGQPDPADATRLTWYPEEQTLSAFLVSMWKWILSGE